MAPKVSICVITYNHENFIAQALDSVLMQETNFDYEIVIGDDCSTDDTRNILFNYREKSPDRIKLLLAEKNSGAIRNFINIYKACQGEYVALLEGDDYWTSPSKLQEQVDFLDNHPAFVMCFTNGRIVNEDGDIIKESRLDEDRRKNLSQSEIISGLVPPTNTVVFRNNVIKKIPDEFYSIINGDIFLFSMLAEHGDAAYIPGHTACYRIHGGGNWSTTSDAYRYRNYLKTYKTLLSIFRKKYRTILFEKVNGAYIALLGYYWGKKEMGSYIKLYLSFILFDLKYADLSFLYYVSQILKLLYPAVNNNKLEK